MLKAEDLRQFALFEGLQEDELESIAGLAERQEFQPHRTVFTPEMCPTDIYLLEEGNDSIQMEVPGKGGEPGTVVHTISRGELFCWSALCPPVMRATTARVVQPATVVIVEGNGLRKLLDENEHAGYTVMKNLCGILSKRLAYVTLVLTSELTRCRVGSR